LNKKQEVGRSNQQPSSVKYQPQATFDSSHGRTDYKGRSIAATGVQITREGQMIDKRGPEP